MTPPENAIFSMKRRTRRRTGGWGWLGWGVCGLLVVGALTLGGGYMWLRSSLPMRAGTLQLSAIAAPVDIVRDRHGVPHIRARNDADAYFALGFVHAQDRLFQMELMRRLGAGRLSEIAGSATVDIDRRMRLFGLYRLAEAAFDHLSPRPRAALEAYAAGVNAHLAAHSGILAPEFAAFGLEPEPWRPADSLVWGRIMGMRLSGNPRTELLRAGLSARLSRQQIDALWPGPTGAAPPTLDNAAAGAGETRSAGRRRDRGGTAPRHGWNQALSDALLRAWPAPLRPVTASNSWVVSGRHTETGRPILVNDPHLRFSAPILWYLARIETPELTVTGATVPGVPFTILGHNGTIAWAFTTADSDTQDLFVEELDPADPDRYLTLDGARPFGVRTERIEVRGGPPVDMTIRETRHGPVVSDLDAEARQLVGDTQVVALAATALRPADRTAEAIWMFNRAASWEAFLEAARHFHAPHQNITYADIHGNIGFIAPGRVPIRRSGDGSSPSAGLTGTEDWIGDIPFNALPRIFNPASGRIVNANHPTVGRDYPYHLGFGGAPPYRALRIHEMIDEGRAATPDKAAAMLLDDLSLAARELVPLMTHIPAREELAARALALLRGWNGRMDADRPEPLLFSAWLRTFNRLVYADETGPLFARVWGMRPVFIANVLRNGGEWCDDIGTERRESCAERLSSALDQTLRELVEAHGDDIERWRWGAEHYAHFRHPMLGRIPVLKHVGDIRFPSSGGAFTVNRGQYLGSDRSAPFANVHGPGFRAVYDLSRLDDSLFVIATGQSGNPLSGHYRDLAPLWAEGRYIRIGGLAAASDDSDAKLLRLTPEPGQTDKAL